MESSVRAWALVLASAMSMGCQRHSDAPAEQARATPTEALGASESAANIDSAAVDASTAQVDQSIDKLLGDHTRYRVVIDSLQQAVRAGDAAAVARLVDYPISVRIDGKEVAVDDESRFVAEYERFMTPAIRKAIVETAYPDVMVNSNGVMLGSGEVWINGICQEGSANCEQFDVKVVTIQPAVQ